MTTSLHLTSKASSLKTSNNCARATTTCSSQMQKPLSCRVGRMSWSPSWASSSNSWRRRSGKIKSASRRSSSSSFRASSRNLSSGLRSLDRSLERRSSSSRRCWVRRAANLRSCRVDTITNCLSWDPSLKMRLIIWKSRVVKGNRNLSKLRLS